MSCFLSFTGHFLPVEYTCKMCFTILFEYRCIFVVAFERDIYLFAYYNFMYYFLILSICLIWIFISYLSRYFAHMYPLLVSSINNVSLKIISTCSISSQQSSIRISNYSTVRYCHSIDLPNNTKPLIPLNCPFIKLETPADQNSSKSRWARR